MTKDDQYGGRNRKKDKKKIEGSKNIYSSKHIRNWENITKKNVNINDTNNTNKNNNIK